MIYSPNTERKQQFPASNETNITPFTPFHLFKSVFNQFFTTCVITFITMVESFIDVNSALHRRWSLMTLFWKGKLLKWGSVELSALSFWITIDRADLWRHHYVFPVANAKHFRNPQNKHNGFRFRRYGPTMFSLAHCIL